jgi:hypothetical protein
MDPLDGTDAPAKATDSIDWSRRRAAPFVDGLGQPPPAPLAPPPASGFPGRRGFGLATLAAVAVAAAVLGGAAGGLVASLGHDSGSE